VSLATARARFVWYGSMHATWCASLCSEQTAESQDSLRIACTFDGRLLLRRLLRVFECAKVHASSRYERSAIRKSLPLSLFISLSLSLSLSRTFPISLSLCGCLAVSVSASVCHLCGLNQIQGVRFWYLLKTCTEDRVTLARTPQDVLATSRHVARATSQSVRDGDMQWYTHHARRLETHTLMHIRTCT
jgi:hypothetical protein